MKKCSSCGENKPATAEYYLPTKYVKSGLMSKCRDCTALYKRAYRENINQLATVQPRKNYESGAKSCPGCSRELPVDECHFYRRFNSNDGYHALCKECEGHKFSKPIIIARLNYKICSTCRRELPATPYYFSRNIGTHDGILAKCKECSGNNFIIESSVFAAEGNKLCVNCGSEFPLTSKYFPVGKGGKGTFRGRCKRCISNDFKKYRSENIKKISLYSKKYREDNGDYVHKLNIKWRLENQEQIKKYRREHSGESRIHRHNRRARALSLPSTLTLEQWEQCKLHFNNRCAYCNADAPLAQDHFQSLSRHFGSYEQSNIIPACKSCNSSKGAKTFSSWYPTFKHYSKTREAKILKYLGYKNNVQQLSLI